MSKELDNLSPMRLKKVELAVQKSGLVFSAICSAVAVLFGSIVIVDDGFAAIQRPAVYYPTGSSNKAERERIKKLTTKDLAPVRYEVDIFSDVKAPEETTGLNSDIFDSNMTREMRQRYSEYDQQYQARDPYQLNDWEKEYQFNEKTKETMDWTMSRLVEYHIDKFINHPPKSSKTLQSVSKSMKAVQEVQNPELNLAPNTQAKFRFDVPNSRMQLRLKSPLFDSEAVLKTRPLNPLLSNRAPDERVHLGANRKITITDTTAFVDYGLDASRLNFGASQQLFGPFSAQVEQSHFFNQPSRDETVYRLNMSALLPQN